jgi:hypothetical protein
MLALVVCVNAPAALRLFPLSVPRLIGRGLLLPALLSLPGVAGVWLRPRFGHALADFVTDGVLYSALTLPLLELARRRQRLGLRG